MLHAYSLSFMAWPSRSSLLFTPVEKFANPLYRAEQKWPQSVGFWCPLEFGARKIECGRDFSWCWSSASQETSGLSVFGAGLGGRRNAMDVGLHPIRKRQLVEMLLCSDHFSGQ